MDEMRKRGSAERDCARDAHAGGVEWVDEVSVYAYCARELDGGGKQGQTGRRWRAVPGPCRAVGEFVVLQAAEASAGRECARETSVGPAYLTLPLAFLLTDFSKSYPAAPLPSSPCSPNSLSQCPPLLDAKSPSSLPQAALSSMSPSQTTPSSTRPLPSQRPSTSNALPSVLA